MYFLLFIHPTPSKISKNQQKWLFLYILLLENIIWTCLGKFSIFFRYCCFWPFLEGLAGLGVNFGRPNCVWLTRPLNRVSSGIPRSTFWALGRRGSDQPGQRYSVKSDIFKKVNFGVNNNFFIHQARANLRPFVLTKSFHICSKKWSRICRSSLYNKLSLY